MKVLEILREGIEVRSLKAIGHKNRKGEIDAIMVVIPLKWAKKMGIKPGDELMAIFDSKYRSVTYIKAPEEET